MASTQTCKPDGDGDVRLRRLFSTLNLYLLGVHGLAYLVTNGVFLAMFGRAGLWWGAGLLCHAGFVVFLSPRLLKCAAFVARRQEER